MGVPRKKLPFTFQPQFPPQIALSNPISRGLVDAALPIGGRVISVAGTQGNQQWNDTSSPQSALHWRWGNAKSYVAATPTYSSRNAAPVPFNASASTLKECSMLVLWQTPSAIGGTRFACGYGLSSASNPVFALGLDSTGTHLNAFIRDAGGTSQITGGALTAAASTDYAIILSRSEAINFHRLYVNGALDLNAAATSLGAVSFDRTALGTCVRNTTANAAGGIISLMLVWNRALSPTEALSLYQNPWQVFEAPQPSVWADIPAAPPGGFNPGWAYGATKTIGAVF